MSGTWRSPGSSADTTTGPRAKCDSVVYEAIAKASEIIVQARSGPSFSRNTQRNNAINLHVPEVESVRSILQKWRRSLHVPLRLDVFYQHGDDAGSERELLERWCLTYEGGAADMEQQFQAGMYFVRSHCAITTCLQENRRLVAVFVHHTSNASIASTAVLTPYGPLYWRVWYAPNVMRLLKQNVRGESRPIRIRQQQQPDASYIRVPKQAHSAPAHYKTLSDASGRGALQYGTSHPVRAGAGARRTRIGRSNSLVEDDESHIQHHETARPMVQRSNSLKPDEDVSSPASLSKPRSGLSLAMMEHESASAQARRTALHHPPPATTQQHAHPAEHSYGYGYNQVLPPPTARALTPTTPQQPAFSSSPTTLTPPPLSSTPPAFAHIAPGPLIPPRNLSSAAPPFSGLPTVLSDPELMQQQQGEEEDHNDSLSILPPISSLDLLHSSPFKAGGIGGGSVLSSLLTESSVLKHSMKLSGMAQHQHQIVVPGRKFSRDEDEDDGDDDMPFAVEQPSENLQESAVASLAHKCATASRLQLFESSVAEQPKSADNTNPDMVSSLADQLAEFRTFGASLHVSTPTMTPIHSRRGSDASAGAGGKQSGAANDGSTSTLISTRS